MENNINSFEEQFTNNKYFEGGKLGSSANQRQIIASDVYQKAKALFSKSQDPVWMQRLQAIVQSAQTYTANNPFSELFNGQQLQDKNNEVISLALQQIQELISEYQQFQNSLPSTQVQQFKDAGLNPLTQSIGGSSISAGVQPQTTGVPNTTPLSSTIDTLVGLVTSTTGGILSFITAGVDISQKITNNRFDNISKIADLAGKGFSINKADFPKQYHNVIDVIQSASPAADAATREQMYKARETALKNLYLDGFSSFVDEEGLKDIMTDLAKLRMDTLKSDYSLRLSSNRYQKEKLDTLDPGISAISENQKNAYDANYYTYKDVLGQVDSENTANKTNIERNKNNEILERNFSEMIKKWVQKSDEGNILYSYLLMNLRNSSQTGIGEGVGDLISLVGKFL